jgi:hypothetical protein
MTASKTPPAPQLPEGFYPFADTRMPLGEMAMMEAPAELEALLLKAAHDDGIEILRDTPVELVCVAAGHPDATFLVYWPAGVERLNILAPREFVKGRA